MEKFLPSETYEESSEEESKIESGKELLTKKITKRLSVSSFKKSKLDKMEDELKSLKELSSLSFNIDPYVDL